MPEYVLLELELKSGVDPDELAKKISKAKGIDRTIISGDIVQVLCEVGLEKTLEQKIKDRATIKGKKYLTEQAAKEEILNEYPEIAKNNLSMSYEIEVAIAPYADNLIDRQRKTYNRGEKCQ